MPNRVCFHDSANAAVAEASSGGKKAAVLLLDLNGFKEVNDKYGHHLGDLLLIEVSRTIRNRLPRECALFRMGGDEFAVLAAETDRRSATEIAESIVDALNRASYRLQGYSVRIQGSIGIAVYPEDGQTPGELLKHADIAMYSAKQSGVAFRAFRPDLFRAAVREIEVRERLKTASENGEFTLAFQPQIELLTGRVIGAEALIRWNNDSLGLVMPSEFIPIAERWGLIAEIGQWVLRRACEHNVAWQREHDCFFRVAVNVSASQLFREEFVPSVIAILRETGLEAKYLELEITESVMVDGAKSIAILEKLKRIGVCISIDDFGAGYSSLQYLQNLPVDKLKIDRSFLSGEVGSKGRSIVSAVISLAHHLKLRVIAEGVETEEQHRYLLHERCDEIQGYLIGRPKTALKFIEWLSSFREGEKVGEGIGS
ncbi:EAL domain-containing protein [Paenibacillus sp. TRM 82003]|nr:EAL domain-containing protein [Paenibacillus sp. TRM 82003]